jgi:hypothetical protein
MRPAVRFTAHTADITAGREAAPGAGKDYGTNIVAGLAFIES